MSLDAVTSRVSELQALLARPVGSQAATPVAFASQLQAATTTAPAAATPGSDASYDSLITAAARRNGIDPALLKGLIKQESGFDPSAGSAAGAQGLTQLMPGTAAALGVSNPMDPAQSIEGGAKYLAQQLKAFNGDASLALAAYNAGPGAVQRAGGIPPYAETQNYVHKVLGYADACRRSLG